MAVNIEISWSPAAEQIHTHIQWNELMPPENCVTWSTSTFLHPGPVCWHWSGCKGSHTSFGSFQAGLSPSTQETSGSDPDLFYGLYTDPEDAKSFLSGNPQRQPTGGCLSLVRINPHFTKGYHGWLHKQVVTELRMPLVVSVGDRVSL